MTKPGIWQEITWSGLTLENRPFAHSCNHISCCTVSWWHPNVVFHIHMDVICSLKSGSDLFSYCYINTLSIRRDEQIWAGHENTFQLHIRKVKSVFFVKTWQQRYYHCETFFYLGYGLKLFLFSNSHIQRNRGSSAPQ